MTWSAYADWAFILYAYAWGQSATHTSRCPFGSTVTSPYSPRGNPAPPPPTLTAPGGYSQLHTHGRSQALAKQECESNFPSPSPPLPVVLVLPFPIAPEARP